jgi:uncharacterized protein
LDRVFLDANVLFSAAHATGSCFLELWRRKRVRLLSSEYAVQEASRNLTGVERLKRLKRLVEKMEIVAGHTLHFPLDVPVGVNLPEKDEPILAAAINARATHLLTGDRRHFGKCFGKRIRGVLIQTPAQYLGDKSGPPRGA